MDVSTTTPVAMAARVSSSSAASGAAAAAPTTRRPRSSSLTGRPTARATTSAAEPMKRLALLCSLALGVAILAAPGPAAASGQGRSCDRAAVGHYYKLDRIQAIHVDCGLARRLARQGVHAQRPSGGSRNYAYNWHGFQMLQPHHEPSTDPHKAELALPPRPGPRAGPVPRDRPRLACAARATGRDPRGAASTSGANRNR